jgi:hypothetical protein
LEAKIPKAPDTPEASSQPLNARVVAHKMAPFNKAVYGVNESKFKNSLGNFPLPLALEGS